MRKQTLVSHIYWIHTYAEVNSAFKFPIKKHPKGVPLNGYRLTRE